MTKTITENLADAGTQVVKTAKSVGSNIAAGAGNAVEMAKETVGIETKNV